MEGSKQIEYHDIHCCHCGQKNTADLVAFDFTTLFAMALSQDLQSEWACLLNLDLHFYLTIRDLCQEFDYQCDYQNFNNLSLKAKDVKKQLEFIMNVPFEVIERENNDSQLYNTLYKKISLNQEHSKQTMNDIMALINVLSRVLHRDPDTIILTIPIKFTLGKDDHGHVIPRSVKYRLNDQEYENKERICPHCGQPYYHSAGIYEEYIVSLAGLNYAGKTSYIDRLIDCLNQSDKIHFNHHSYQQIVHFELMDCVCLPIEVFNKTYNFMLIDISGGVFNYPDISEGVNYVYNKCPIFTKAQMLWCFLTPEMFKGSQEDNMTMLTRLTNTIEKIFNHRMRAAIIISHSDEIDERYGLSFPGDRMDDYINEDLTIDFTKISELSNRTRNFMNQEKSIEITIEELFKGYCLFALSAIQPSAYVALPFLWTLGVLGLVKMKRTDFKKTLFNEREIQVEVSDKDMFID